MLMQFVKMQNENADSGKAASYPREIAEKLAEYIEKATGAKLPVEKDSESPAGGYEILIGKTNRENSTVTIDRTGFADETVYIEMQGSSLIIASDEQYQATYYAMYSFLEECMGFFVMGNGAELCTPSRGIDVKDGYVFKDSPSSELRLNNQMGGWDEALRSGEITHRFCNLVHSLSEFAQPDYDASIEFHLNHFKAGDPCLTDNVPENWTPDIDPELWFYDSVH